VKRSIQLLTFSLVICVGCSRSDRDIREWRPSDHDRESSELVASQTNSLSQADQTTGGLVNQPRGNGPSSNSGTEIDAESTWSNLCSGCHGRLGRDKVPVEARMGVRNLADSTWQRSVTDERIAQSITHGRGRMPAFSFSPQLTAAMVKLIRSFGR
jgi:mono/diheme cytochrome c family protein